MSMGVAEQAMKDATTVLVAIGARDAAVTLKALRVGCLLSVVGHPYGIQGLVASSYSELRAHNSVMNRCVYV